jgi:enamine deaminase RidA (YjgF/YER057c/UK114 family)
MRRDPVRRFRPRAAQAPTTLLALAAVAAGCASGAQDAGTIADELQKELINPPGSEDIYRTWQFSQGVRSGRMLWVSGQLGVDPETGTVPEDVESQARLALRNLEGVISEAGGSLSDVVELVTYHTDMRELEAFARVKREFFTEGFPAWTAVGVAALADPRFRLEVRATAVIGSGPAIQEPLEEDGSAPVTDT